jgi:tetratricopeptide (TPR) repeat protein
VVPAPAGPDHVAAVSFPRRGRRQAGLVLGLSALALLAASVGRQYAASRYEASGAAKLASSPRAALGGLQTAAQLDPYSLRTLYTIASAYARLDDYADARATLLVAQRREPHNYVPPALLGDLAMRRGDYALAEVEYGRAVSLNPRDPSVASALAAAEGARR